MTSYYNLSIFTSIDAGIVKYNFYINRDISTSITGAASVSITIGNPDNRLGVDQGHFVVMAIAVNGFEQVMSENHLARIFKGITSKIQNLLNLEAMRFTIGSNFNTPDTLIRGYVNKYNNLEVKFSIKNLPGGEGYHRDRFGQILPSFEFTIVNAESNENLSTFVLVCMIELFKSGIILPEFKIQNTDSSFKEVFYSMLIENFKLKHEDIDHIINQLGYNTDWGEGYEIIPDPKYFESGDLN